MSFMEDVHAASTVAVVVDVVAVVFVIVDVDAVVVAVGVAAIVRRC